MTFGHSREPGDPAGAEIGLAMVDGDRCEDVVDDVDGSAEPGEHRPEQIEEAIVKTGPGAQAAPDESIGHLGEVMPRGPGRRTAVEVEHRRTPPRRRTGELLDGGARQAHDDLVDSADEIAGEGRVPAAHDTATGTEIEPPAAMDEGAQPRQGHVDESPRHGVGGDVGGLPPHRMLAARHPGDAQIGKVERRGLGPEPGPTRMRGAQTHERRSMVVLPPGDATMRGHGARGEPCERTRLAGCGRCVTGDGHAPMLDAML